MCVCVRMYACAWIVKAALDSKQLNGGEASSLAGRLSWGTQHIFRRQFATRSVQRCLPCFFFACRMGRAMLMPIFKQVKRASNQVDEELEKALRWWLEILKDEICEIRYDA